VVSVKYKNNTQKLNLYVVDGNFCGREWISQFVQEINLSSLFAPDHTPQSSYQGTSNVSKALVNAIEIQATDEMLRLQQLLQQFTDVFSTTAAIIKGPLAKVHLKADAKPIFARAREVPFALKDSYAKEIEFYKRVEFSEWASTTHVVTKKNGGIRITGNNKPTVNPQIIIDEHPIPKAEDTFN